uniref:GPI inositol-deacylase n=1 Tax=Varanus komodoensis TaxID=61221 RepID=A0A8D2L1X5_VARKO
MDLNSHKLWVFGAAAAFYGALAALVLLGVRDVLFQYEENRCSMTYMFEYPEYLKIKLPRKISRRYPAYELYLYGEGSYAEENRNLILTGIPVLFLPGNAGSYKQVRSFGSIALRKAEDIDYKYHFDVFSVNFNEELVALYGGSLQRQTRFVHECIKVILKLYKGQVFAPRSVTVVGHSMGGLIARALLTLKNFKTELLNILVTQATPHIAPVMPLDQYLTDFYTAVNHNWIQKAQEIRNLTTLSVAGGFRDYQVRSGLAFLPKLDHQSSALSVVSSAVPRVWASTDHLSVVWCKELILATVRAFLDLIDENTKQITEDPHKRMLILNHHFLRHPAKLFEDISESVIELTGSLTWIQIKAPKWSYTVHNESDGKYFTFPLSSHRKSYSHVYCQSSMLVRKGFPCKHTFVCLAFHTVTLKLEDYPSLTYLVLHVPAVSSNKFTLDCEFFNETSRTLQLPVTQLFTFGRFNSFATSNSLKGLYSSMHFHLLLPERKPNVYRLHIPWSHEDSLTLSQVPSSTEISAKLHIAQPENDTTVPLLTIYSSSDCQYEVSKICQKVIRFYGGALPVYIISNILLAYGRQLRSLISTGQCSDFVPALTKAAKPYKVEPIVNIIKFLLGLNWFKGIWNLLFLPELDVVTLSNQDLCFPFISLILFMFGTGIAYWGGMLLDSSIRLSSFLYLVLIRPSGLSLDNCLITRRRLCVAAFMFFLSWTTCGALAIIITYFHYIFKVFNQTSSSSTTAMDSFADSLKMHTTVINLLTWIVLLSCPSLIYWLKNLRYHSRLDPDPYRSVALVLIAILEILMNTSTTKVKSSKLLKIAVHLPLPCSVAVVAFAPMHLYRIPYFVIIPLFLHALCCIL